MSENYIKRNWKLLLNVLTIGALLVLVYALRDQLWQTFKNLGQVHAWALLLMIPIEALNYHAQTKMYQTLFETLGDKLTYKFLMRLSVELNFVNHVFPSGGVSGISFFGVRLRSAGISAAKATMVQTMKLVLLFLSFVILLLFGMFALSLEGRVNNITILIGSTLTTLVAVGTLLFAYIIGSQRRINAMFTNVTRAINKVIHVLHLGQAETINIERAKIAFDEFHHNYLLFKSKLGQLKKPFGYALLANATEVAAAYVVYVAFGHWVNIGAVILAYSVANFAGLVSVLPGGVGVYEALMTAVLISAGIPAKLSIPATVMYRVINTLIQVPPGFVLYNKTLNKGDGETNFKADAKSNK